MDKQEFSNKLLAKVSKGFQNLSHEDAVFLSTICVDISEKFYADMEKSSIHKSALYNFCCELVKE